MHDCLSAGPETAWVPQNAQRPGGRTRRKGSADHPRCSHPRCRSTLDGRAIAIAIARIEREHG
eukprot:13201944-Alexandrium_andersonii.AAC.1